VAECDVFQCNKGETVKTLGTLQPLPIPLAICWDISMEFIVGLPKSGNKLVIMVVVDRLSKYAHFVLFKTHLHPPLWLIFSWIMSSSLMACLILFFLIATPLS
jgi:hypothetical protein